MTGIAYPIDPNRPEPGFYKVRLVRGGPFVPSRIWWGDAERDFESGELIEDEKLCCEVNGARRDPYRWWTRLAKHPISPADFRHLTECARTPGQPEYSPRTPVDYDKMGVPF